jgi:hypothetical protein
MIDHFVPYCPGLLVPIIVPLQQCAPQRAPEFIDFSLINAHDIQELPPNFYGRHLITSGMRSVVSSGV